MTAHRVNQAVRLLNEAAEEQYKAGYEATSNTSALIGNGYAMLQLAESMDRLTEAIHGLSEAEQ